MTRDDRAVSEVVGFALSFSMIVLLVGLLYMGGFTSLASLAEEEQVNNAERAMRALGENIDDVQRGDGPARAGELRLQGGELRLNGSTRLNVTVTTTTGSETSLVEVGALVYRRNGREVWTEAGAVFRNRQGASAMVREPAFRCADDRAIVSLVTLRASSNRTGVAGDGSAVVVTRLRSRQLRFPDGPGETAADAVRVTVRLNRTANLGGWQRYFENHPDWSGSDRAFSCDASLVYVRETVLDVRFIR